jgi:hypothetical protein
VAIHYYVELLVIRIDKDLAQGHDFLDIVEAGD